ncbi:MAG TPA: DUF4936 family protein [Burkholderiaceae bacterium]|nr:DUF4936 family protein [Burkholderiaceae bacterium]HSB98487.1 DUF4936 family protein [Burkholderiaceae bacterium]
MSTARAELYVYYRVAASDWQRAADAVRDFQQQLCLAHRGLIARVLRRSDSTIDEVTLMEIYALADGQSRGIDDDLRRRIDRAAAVLTPWLTGSRQVEVFEPFG